MCILLYLLSETLGSSNSYLTFSITACRTIINGLCYLATFVFGMNSVGLLLYSGQLALNSFSEDSEGSDVKSNEENKTLSSDLSSESPSTRENKDTDQIS